MANIDTINLNGTEYLINEGLRNDIKYGNLNQHIKVNPFVIRSTGVGVGEVRANRSALTVLENGLKVERNSTSATTSYGFFLYFNPSDETQNTNGHKIYIRVSGIDITYATHYSKFRTISSYNGTSTGGVNVDVSDVSSGMFEFICTPNANINQFTLNLMPDSAPANGEYFTITSMQIIDLTEMFGAGNEPNVYEFSSIYSAGMPYPFIAPTINSGVVKEARVFDIVSRDYDIIDSISDMSSVTKDKVLVLHNDSPYGDGGACWFEYLNYATENGYARADGGKMYPMLDQGTLFPNNAPVQKMWNIMTSYLENDSLIYGNNYTMFDTTTTNEIDCGTFVSAVLDGIPYGESKYVIAANRKMCNLAEFSPTSGSSTGYALSRDMAQYFGEQKWLHKMPPAYAIRNTLKFGDILFAKDGTSASESRFLKIGHVAIVLYAHNTRIVVAQCGAFQSGAVDTNLSSTVGKITILLGTDESIAAYYPAFARIPYFSCEESYMDSNLCYYENGVMTLKPVMIPGCFIDETTGAISSSTKNCISANYIRVKPRTILRYTGSHVANTSAFVAEYDENLTFISRTTFGSTPKVLESNTRYILLQYGYTDSTTMTAAVANGTSYSISEIESELNVQNHSAAIFSVGKTYLDVAFDPNDRLAYAEGIGLYQENVKNSSDIKCISCSQFVQACLSGVYYNYSRYMRTSNEVSNWGFLSGGYGTTSTSYGDYLTANEMGNFFQSRGQLRELNSTYPQAKVGDILLHSNGSTFYHVSICTGISPSKVWFLQAADKGTMFPEGLPRICDGEEAGVYIRSLPWSSQYAPTHFVSADDIITDTILTKVDRIAIENTARTGSYSGTSAYIRTLTQDIEHGLYTFVAEDSGSGNSQYYIKIYYYKADGTVPSSAEEAQYTETIEGVKYQNKTKGIFYAQLDIRKIDIRCSGGTQYDYEKMELYNNAINF